MPRFKLSISLPVRQKLLLFRLAICSLMLALSMPVLASAVAKPMPKLAGLGNAKSPIHAYRGEVFAAVELPGNIGAKIAALQGQLKKCLGATFSPSPAKNLHITLQLIGREKTKAGFNLINNALHSAAMEIAKKGSWSHAKHTSGFKLTVSGKGLLILRLPRSDRLTHTAATIRQKLKNAGIPHSKRHDFPDHAHITIGAVSGNAKQARLKITKELNSGKIKMNVLRAKSFPIDHFVLLKSNRPSPKRDYARLASYSF
jgi:2'-5' RNA ligase